MLRYLFFPFVVSVVVGCSSPVNLAKVPVEDRNAAGTTSIPSSTGSSTTGQSAVTPVSSAMNSADAALASLGRVIYFDYDSSVIRPEFQPIIEASAKLMLSGSGRQLSIAGHTDERGGREYNLALGQKRADAVRRALSLLGVSEAQMEAVSFGKEKPAIPGATEAAMEKNRRAEVGIQ